MEAVTIKEGIKFGELARRTGVSVRTLHYYEEIGLLAPPNRSELGYRLYATEDILRLQKVKSLRQLGFSLEEVRDCLSQPEFSLLRVIDLHIRRLRDQIALQNEFCNRLEKVAESLHSAAEVSVEKFIQIIEVISMVETYYTPEQMEQLKQRANTVGEERIRQVETEWAELMALVQTEMDKATDPAHERVQALAQKWMGLVQEFTGGDPGIEQSLGNMWNQEENIHGIDTAKTRKMGEYISKAIEAAKAD